MLQKTRDFVVGRLVTAIEQLNAADTAGDVSAKASARKRYDARVRAIELNWDDETAVSLAREAALAAGIAVD